MKNEHLYIIIGAAVLLALLGTIVLSAVHVQVPDILPYAITSGLGALAMAAKGGSDSNGSASPNQ